MRKQTLEGAIWIPACLLEIVPNQPMTAPLQPRHTSEMIRYALRYPAANAALIDQEGLELLGLKAPAVQGSNRDLVCDPPSKLARY